MNPFIHLIRLCHTTHTGTNRISHVIQGAHESSIFALCMLRNGTLLSGGKDRRLLSWDGSYQQIQAVEVRKGAAASSLPNPLARHDTNSYIIRQKIQIQNQISRAHYSALVSPSFKWVAQCHKYYSGGGGFVLLVTVRLMSIYLLPPHAKIMTDMWEIIVFFFVWLLFFAGAWVVWSHSDHSGRQRRDSTDWDHQELCLARQLGWRVYPDHTGTHTHQNHVNDSFLKRLFV